MALPIYLALTDWEYRYCQKLPAHTAWLSCSFSSCGTGLANIPTQLPEDSILLVSDQIPPQDHNPDTVAEQLRNAADSLKLRGVMLDFQRPYTQETANMAACIVSALPCPVAIPPAYCHDRQCTLCLPPVPLDESIETYLQPYAGQEIWLEIEKSGEELILTADGCHRQILKEPLCEPVFSDDPLCCHYRIQVFPDKAVFSLERTWEDTLHLLKKAEAFGVSLAVGLYQEFG